MSQYSPKEGEIVELEIQETSRDGRGIARMKGLIIFVNGAKVGQTVRARITKRGARQAQADAID